MHIIVGLDYVQDDKFTWSTSVQKPTSIYLMFRDWRIGHSVHLLQVQTASYISFDNVTFQSNNNQASDL